MIFRRSSRQRPLTRQQAISARPVQLVTGQLTDIVGGARLKVPLKVTRWSGWLGLPAGATKSFELDELGLFVWNSCDGKTTVEQIIHRLAKERRLSVREVEVATLQFLQTLTRKGLIGMPVENEQLKEGRK